MLWPLPGGGDSYLSSLREFIMIAEEGPTREEFIERIVDLFPGVTSSKTAGSYLLVTRSLGFLELRKNRVGVTKAGRDYLRTDDLKIVRQALVERIAGVRELLDELKRERKPARIGTLQERMATHGFAWRTLSQLRYRLKWLEQVGLVQHVGKKYPEYSARTMGLTSTGKRAKAASTRAAF